jgi:spermidine synthase
MTPQARRVAPLLFGSGMCALIYQVAWFREMRLVFGASTAANAAVLAIFIGGIGTGSIVLGRRADRHPRPVRMYANLELGVALCTALTPVALMAIRRIYVALGGTATLGLAGGTIARLVLSAVVLAAPTFFMGGTFPAAARGVESSDDDGRKNAGLLYGANATGAVIGSLVSTFWLLEAVGTRATLWAGCLVNLAIALTARWVSRRMPAETEPARPDAPAEPAGPITPAWFTLSASAIVGFAFFLMELVWYRMLGPILGGTVFTFGLILAIALLGIGVGGVTYALVGKNRPASLTGFAYTCLLEAALLALPYALGDRIAVLALLLRPLGGVGFSGFVLSWTLVTVIVVLPAAFVSGVQFPLLIALLGRGRDEIGRQAGLAYAFNTLGAIVGSLAGGFGLMPLLSAPGCWRAVAGILVVLGLGAVALALWHGRRVRTALVPAAIGAGVVAMLCATGPTAAWRHSAIGVGRVEDGSTTSPQALHRWKNKARRDIIWETDGVESSVAIDGSNGLAFVVNGKIDGNIRGDAPTQVMGGLVGAILHGAPRSAMVIGLGTGSTAGWLGGIDGIERVDVVELEPAILHVARASAVVNRNVLSNPKVHVAIGDAREALLSGSAKYDLVFSEPSNPYRAGIASLFTEEYYRAVRARLKPGGLFLQWVQAYNVDSDAVRTVYATLGAVFPAVETWELARKDLLLVASESEVAHDVARLRSRITEEPYRTALAVAWRAVDLEGVFGHYVAGPSMARTIAQIERGRLNTDDKTIIEFGFARAASDTSGLSSDDVRKAAVKMGANRPTSITGEIDWERARDEWTSFRTAEEDADDDLDGLSADRWASAKAQSQYLDGTLTTALASWRSQSREPRNPTEIAVVADLWANAAEPYARKYIEQLRPYQPAEADAILGRLLVRQGKLSEGASALGAAFERCRTDVWPWMVVIGRALDTAEEIASREPAVAGQLYDSLSVPFAGRVQESTRMRVLVKLAPHVARSGLCVDLAAKLEPHVPWTEDFLRWRSECYRAARHPLERRAAADLVEYQKNEPASFARGL